MESDRVRRTMEVLGFLAEEGPRTVTEVATSLSLPVSSTHDLLKAMVRGGVASVTSQGYDVGPVAARLALKIGQRMDVAEASAPELHRLLERVGFDVYLAVRTGNEIIYASRFRGRQGVNLDIPLGLPLYRHATAAGKLFAAYDREIRQEVLAGPLPKLTALTRSSPTSLAEELDIIRARGFSISREEAVMGVIGLAAPIVHAGTIVGAAHISALRSRLDDASLHRVSEELLKSAAVIEEKLNGGQPATSAVEPVVKRVHAPLVDGSAVPRT